MEWRCTMLALLGRLACEIVTRIAICLRSGCTEMCEDQTRLETERPHRPRRDFWPFFKRHYSGHRDIFCTIQELFSCGEQPSFALDIAYVGRFDHYTPPPTPSKGGGSPR